MKNDAPLYMHFMREPRRIIIRKQCAVDVRRTAGISRLGAATVHCSQEPLALLYAQSLRTGLLRRNFSIKRHLNYKVGALFNGATRESDCFAAR